MVLDSIPAVVNQCGVHAVKQHAQAPMAEVHVHNPRLLSTSDRSLNQCVPDQLGRVDVCHLCIAALPSVAKVVMLQLQRADRAL